ncbi:FG-GAP-like repeat-containing protein [Streptacidiphilus cavernicola]|uniref:FG-GAP-like repeat-containing protein n=1 Tax=Streptacidiphilus cavernicola TaxID=3342716 RepID=A0ABV6VS76_9ACTN
MNPRPTTARRVRRTAALLAVTALGAAGLAVPAQAAPQTAPAAARDDGSPTAAATLKARTTGKPVPITALTTATRQVTAQPDGSLTDTLSALPARVFQGGRWVPIDTTLRRNADGTLSPTAVATDLVLSGGGDTALATLTASGRHLSIAWPTALPVPTLAGDTATYHEVLPGTDLTVTATDQGGVSEVLVVKTPQAAANPALRQLDLATTGPGLSVSADAHGNLTASDAHGDPVFYAPTPAMWDSSTSTPPTGNTAGVVGNGRSTFRTPGFGAHRAKIATRVTGGHTVSLAPDASMLTASTTHYPVYVDPTWSFWTGKNGPGFAEVQAGCADSANSYDNTTYESDGEGVGYNGWSGCIGVEETYYQFTLPAAVYGTDINDATLKTLETYTSSGSLSATVSAHLATSAIGKTTSWNTRPGYGAALNPQSVGPATSSSQPSTGFTVTSAITGAKKGAVVTFALTGDEKSADRDYLKRFSTTPTLVVKYNNKPKVASAYTAPGSSCAKSATAPTIGSTAITLKAELTDIESGSTMTAHFTYSHDGGSQIAASPATGSPSVRSGGVEQWNIGDLPSGKYSWNVYADDGIDHSATTTCYFTVDADAPAAPSITSSLFPVTDQDATATPNPDRTTNSPYDFTFTPPAGTTDVKSYSYAWGTPPPTVNPTQTTTAAGGSAPTPITLIPPGMGLNTLYVRAIDASGNVSTTAQQDFWTHYTNPTATLDNDFNDDGTPDVIGVGSAANPGLWLYNGAAGQKLEPPVQIGNQGTFGGGGTADDWDGAQVSHGVLLGDEEAYQDLLVHNGPALDIYAGSGNPGDGSSFSASADANSVTPVLQVDGSGQEVPADWDNDRQIVPAGALDPNLGSGIWINPNVSTGVGADLWAVQGDELGYYAAGSTTGDYSPFQVISTSGWANKTIVNAGTVGGLPALWARDNTTGELDLYTGSSDPATGIVVAGSPGTRTVVATSGYATTDYAMLESAGDTGPGNCPQLWGISTASMTFSLIPCTGPTTLGAPGVATGTANGLEGIDGAENTFTFAGIADFNGDGHPDIIAADSIGLLWLYPGDAGHDLHTPRVLIGHGWGTFTFAGVGDWNGDGHPDVIVRDATGVLWVYPGNGSAGFGPHFQIGNGWNTLTFAGVTDWNGDGHPDVIVRDANGGLWVYPGNGGTGFGPHFQIGNGWNTLTFAGVTDWNGDGHPDIVALDANNTLWVYPGNGGTGFSARIQIGTDWGNLTFAGSTDWDGDGHPDEIARDYYGRLWVYHGTGTAFGTRSQIGSRW